MKRFTTAAAVIFACLALPSAATADSGSISNVFTAGPEVSASYTATGTSCEASGFCGYFPYAVEVPPSVGCYPYNSNVEDGGRLTWVGETADQFQSQSGTDTFFPDSDPVKICLYVRGTERPHTLVAEYVHNVKPPAVAPPPVSPPVTDEAVPEMGISEARGYLRGILRKKYGKRFSASTFRRSCYQPSEKIRCNVSWKKRPYKYSGSVTLWNDPNDADSFLYRVNVKRKRVARSSSLSLGAQAADMRSAMGVTRRGDKAGAKVRAVASHSCSRGKHAVIGGAHKCLARGQFCARARDREYHRYGFHCHTRDARGNYHLT